jgi:uncharacterized protein
LKKRKILNDPIYGFIAIDHPLVLELIDHPYFQRLRRIRQLGLTDFVYPGALHTRFHHVIGAMHLMSKALHTLRGKGVEIDESEFEACLVAILLHDIGHGPFSHALEYSLIPGIKHESISYQFLKYFNEYFGHRLDLALRIFRDSYERKFFHQLVASQLDMDRLDYLRRDSYFAGVFENTIGVDRIIQMLHVVDDAIVVEEKGIYSIENFLNARRLMYWQVYLHKTSIAAEQMLVNIIQRAKYLAHSGAVMPGSTALRFFLDKDRSLEDFQQNPEVLRHFGKLDDHDIWGAIKEWSDYPDRVLSALCTLFLERKLFKIQLSGDPLRKEDILTLRKKAAAVTGLTNAEARYFFGYGEVSNAGYVGEGQRINILTRKGQLVDVADASDLPNIAAMSKIVKKYYLCWAKNVSL